MEKSLVSFYRGILIFIMTMSSGCSMPFVGGYGEHGQSKEEFARYVEDVFRLQNSMTSEVMMLMESEGDSENYGALLKAEQHMHQICAPLNEYASRDNDGLSVGLLLTHDIVKSATDCEQAARRVESLLKE